MWTYEAKSLTPAQEEELGLEILLDEFESEFGIDRQEAEDLIISGGGYNKFATPEDYF